MKERNGRERHFTYDGRWLRILLVDELVVVVAAIAHYTTARHSLSTPYIVATLETLLLPSAIYLYHLSSLLSLSLSLPPVYCVICAALKHCSNIHFNERNKITETNMRHTYVRSLPRRVAL